MASIEFHQLLDDLGAPYVLDGHHHCRPGWLQMDCPFCGKDSGKFHMGYSLSERYVHCWKCGPHPLAMTVAAIAGIDVRSASRLLKDIRPGRPRERQATPKAKLQLPTGIEPMQKPHKKYLKARGFDPDEVESLWGVQGLGRCAGDLSWRLFIPIHLKGKTVSWTTRNIGNRGLRYISAAGDQESHPHKTMLYGEDHAKHAIVVCEGPIDVWRLGEGAVATFGLSFCQAQIQRIAQYPVRAILFDAEPAAKQQAIRLTNLLAPLPGDTYRVELDRGDVCDMSNEDLDAVRDKFLRVGR